MTKLVRNLLIAAALAGALPAHSAQLCAWMDETLEDENVHNLKLHLQSDEELSFYYQMAGNGISDESSRAHSPGSGTYVLHPGVEGSPWGFGTNLSPPGDIDIIAEIHETPKDIFSDEPSPLLTSFTFHRHVPDGETAIPKAPFEKQCATVTAPK